MPKVKLYGYATSPYVRKTACFLHYKKIPFEYIPVNPINPKETIGFTGNTRVPILQIDDEWRVESSEHAHWLDELFPEYTLCPNEYKQKIIEVDTWLNRVFLPSIFRSVIDGKLNLNARMRYWRLAAIVSSQTPLPEKIRHQWPEILMQASFIQKMGEDMDLTEDPKDMQMRIGMELVTHIGDGPFIASMECPTMLDFAVFPQVVFGVMAGLEDKLLAAMHPVLKNWIKAVAKHLPENPILIPNYMIVKTVDQALQEI